MYGLRVNETDAMYKRKALDDQIFSLCKDHSDSIGWYITNNVTYEIIWVYSKVRRQGLGRTMIELLGIKHVKNPLQTSIPFWNVVLPETKLE